MQSPRYRPRQSVDPRAGRQRRGRTPPGRRPRRASNLPDETDRAIATLPAGSLWRPWLAQLSGMLGAGAGLRVMLAVARRDGGEVA